MNRFITRRALGISVATCALALPAAASAHPQKAVCGQASAGYARCFAHVRTDSHGAPAASVAPAGYGPARLQAAYALTSASSSAGGSQTVAIVDAYDDPNAEKDLGVYRVSYGLKPCTSASGCFHKVSQTGQSRYPRADNGWAQEISLDLDMVSAVCPNCHILLVEASSNSFQNLLAAENYAASHATEVSNSWGASEFSAESSYDSAFSHPGVPITASSGDAGFGVEWPAASPNVTAVGGTSLSAAQNSRGYTESAWSGAGSGCSAYEHKPTWQTDIGCSRRTVADVSADADPNTGVSVYDTYVQSGWLVFGGTSVAAPVIASTYALAGNGQTAGLGFPYGHATSLFDVTTGSNGSCTSGYLCTAGNGYDGPTGLGTPNGTAAF